MENDNQYKAEEMSNEVINLKNTVTRLYRKMLNNFSLKSEWQKAYTLYSEKLQALKDFTADNDNIDIRNLCFYK